MLKYELLTTGGLARHGRMTLNRGVVETPIFMSVGTYDVVRVMPPVELRDIGARVVLGSTFRLWLRPGLKVMGTHKGLHGLSGWDRPILTDSDGFQVFSLDDLCRITEEDVTFVFPTNSDRLFLSPEILMQIQCQLNSDTVMRFDGCTPYKIDDRPAAEVEAAASIRMSLRQTQRLCNEFERGHNPNALFGIVQGGMFENPRNESLAGLRATDADVDGEGSGGYATGGLSVRGPKEDMMYVLQYIAPCLPANKPHYLMDVGTPEDFVAGVASGVDISDCVMPTRDVHNGRLSTRFDDIKTKNAVHHGDPRSLGETCDCYTCNNFSRAYLYHLQRVGEILGTRLNTIHNLYYYLELMAEMRATIEPHGFAAFQTRFAAGRVRGAL